MCPGKQKTQRTTAGRCEGRQGSSCSVVTDAVWKPKPSYFRPRLIWFQHCAFSFRFSHVFPLLTMKSVEFCVPWDWHCCLWGRTAGFHLSPQLTSWAVTAADTQSYTVQATDWQRVQPLKRKCMMPVCFLPFRLHRGNAAIPRNFKVQAKFTRLAGK